ncbi:MAG TPA: hypothetical protein VKB92_08300 [Myxococcales bacterium]|nr:hypothetical protein [Myxococcales bacterium]
MLRYARDVLLPLLMAAVSLSGPPAPLAAAKSAPRAAPSQSPAPASMFAVGPPELLAALGSLRPKVGSWAEYLVRASGEEDVRVRLSVVPPALDGGRAWLEVAALGDQDLPFGARLLVGGSGRLERAIVYALGLAPIEVPLGELQPAETKPARDPAVQAMRVGSAEVTVPAGTFHAEEIRIVARGETTRVWRADQVPLWGLVRVEGRRTVVELTGLGERGARPMFQGDQGKGSESAK